MKITHLSESLFNKYKLKAYQELADSIIECCYKDQALKEKLEKIVAYKFKINTIEVDNVSKVFTLEDCENITDFIASVLFKMDDSAHYSLVEHMFNFYLDTGRLRSRDVNAFLNTIECYIAFDAAFYYIFEHGIGDYTIDSDGICLGFGQKECALYLVDKKIKSKYFPDIMATIEIEFLNNDLADKTEDDLLNMPVIVKIYAPGFNNVWSTAPEDDYLRAGEKFLNPDGNIAYDDRKALFKSCVPVAKELLKEFTDGLLRQTGELK